MKIRRATKKDIEGVVELFGEYDRYENALDKRHKVDSVKERKDFFNLLMKKPRAVVFVLDIDGRLGGVVSGEYRESMIGRGGIIHELIVSKDYRSMGYGKELMKALEDYLKKKGCKSIQSFVFVKNKKVLNFYHKLGYSSNEEGFMIRKRLR
ncbi:MAG TPA: GNAT family N-acetyltransferase [Candidatus Pacearchaeota archaeon]|nr:GNAT family N-acetyltransferase [Candidatus Pacearchaeota archaeon]